jgi:hypothetical protein
VTAASSPVMELAEALRQADEEVRAMARRAGVPEESMDAALKDFSRELMPHAGREVRAHPLKYWKLWWKGYAAGMRRRT